MWSSIKPSLRKKIQTILIYSIRNLILPAINIGLSLLVIRLSSESLWGNFVNYLIWITLAIQFLGWGNKEFLLRVFSKDPAKIAQNWRNNLWSRSLGFLIIGPLFLLLPFSSLSYFFALIWLLSAFLAQSWEVIILYQKRFFLAIWIELVGFGLTAGWIFIRRESLDIEVIITGYMLGQTAKSILLSFFLRKVSLITGGFSFERKHLIQAFPFLLVGLSGMLNSRIDLYMVNGLMPDTEVGKYQVMTSLFIYIQALAGFITQPYVKNIYRLASRKISRLSFQMGGLGIIILLLAIPLCWWILNGLYDFGLSLDFFWLGALLSFPIFWFLPVLYLCYKHNLERPVLMLNLIGILVNIVINYYLIPSLGIKGALIGSVSAQWAILFIYEYYRRKILRSSSPTLSLSEMKQREKILCPICHSPLSLETYNCQNNHQFSQENGVIQLFTPETSARLIPYLENFNQYRKKAGWHINDPTIFPRLPHISEATALGHWKPKQHDLRLIKKLLTGKKSLKILEIGAWNGWLSHHLVKWGHSLTTIDYFDSQNDGLKAMKFYPQDWIALQMEVEDISILAGKYDVIILNRCYAYYTDPILALQKLKKKLVSGGMILLTGLNIYSDGDRRKAEFEAYKENFRKENGFEMMSKPTKGFLDLEDQNALEEEGISLFIYHRMIRHRIKSAFLDGVSRLYWGIYRENE